MEAAASAGLHKLTSRVFPENIASRGLLKGLGFDEIGIHRRHGQLDGRWRDCVIVERLLDTGGARGPMLNRSAIVATAEGCRHSPEDRARELGSCRCRRPLHSRRFARAHIERRSLTLSLSGR